MTVRTVLDFATTADLIDRMDASKASQTIGGMEIVTGIIDGKPITLAVECVDGQSVRMD